MLRVCILCIILTSCIRDADLKVEKLDPQLVIQSVNSVGQRFEVKVAASRSILDPTLVFNDSNFVDDAIVTVYQGEVPMEVLQFSDSSKSYIARNARPAEGYSYMLRVTAPGFVAVTAVAEVPESVLAELVSFTHKAREVNQYGDTEDQVVMRYNDPPQENFYRIKLSLDNHYYYPCLYCQDPDIERINELDDLFALDRCYDDDFFLLRDLSYNNGPKTLTIYFSSYHSAPENRPRIVLDHISKTYFDFLTSKGTNILTQDNPFAEPANVKGNVENGYGIFTIVHSSSRRLRR